MVDCLMTQESILNKGAVAFRSMNELDASASDPFRKSTKAAVLHQRRLAQVKAKGFELKETSNDTFYSYMNDADRLLLAPFIGLHYLNVDGIWSEWTRKHPDQTTTEIVWRNHDASHSALPWIRKDVEADAETIVERLLDPGTANEDKRRLILQSADVQFDEQQFLRIRPYLLSFVEQRRESTNHDELVVVGAAIRKYIAMLPVRDLDSVASLLNAPVSVEVELEVAKMVCRKMTANTEAPTESFRQLAERLMELCVDYLRPRQLPRRIYGATALNCVLGLVLVGGPQLPELFQILQRLNVTWFKQQLSRRTSRLVEELAGRKGNGAKACIERLTTLIASLIEGNLSRPAHAISAVES